MQKHHRLRARQNQGEPRQTFYTLNTALVQYHMEINAFKNKKRRGFAPDVVEKFALEVPAEEGDCFLDDAGALDA